MNSCGVLLVFLSSTFTRKPGSCQHSLSTQSVCLIVFSDWEEFNCHYCYVLRHTLTDASSHMCTTDSTRKHTVEIGATCSSASNVKNSTLIPCFPQRETERGTERPSLYSDSSRSHLADGLIEQRRDTERQSQREIWDTGFGKMKLPHSLSAGEDLRLELRLASDVHKHLIPVKYEQGECNAASGSSLHIWTRNCLAKQTWLIQKAFWKGCERLLCNPGDVDSLVLKKIVFFSSEDPPSKENPYEDIELERSCLGSKCVSPASSSPVPDTPTKVPDHWWITLNQSRFNRSIPILRICPPQLSTKPGFFRQNSERRSFKLLELRKTGRDTGISSPSRISPPSTPSSPDDTPCLSGDPYNRRRRKIPKVWESERPLTKLPLLHQWFMIQCTARGGWELVHSCFRLGMSKAGVTFLTDISCAKCALRKASQKLYWNDFGRRLADCVY